MRKTKLCGSSDLRDYFWCGRVLLDRGNLIFHRLSFFTALWRYSSCNLNLTHFGGSQYSHGVVQPSPQTNVRTFLTLQKETLYLLNSPSPHLLVASNLFCVSVGLSVLDVFYKWSHTISGLLCFWILSPPIMFSRLIHSSML